MDLTDGTGRWLVTTESGTLYLLDLDAETITRCPEPTDIRFQQMSQDGEMLSLVSLSSVAVGDFFEMIVKDFGGLVHRSTTTVVSIEPA